MEVLEAIKTRRSVRKFKATPIDDSTLEAIMEAARWAPSWANTQCPRFVFVRDPGLKIKIAEALKTNRPDRPNAATEAIKAAPVVIVACAEMGKSGFYHGAASTDKGDWFMFDTALAMENIVLAANGLGLGTVIIGLFDAGKIASILELPAGFSVVAITPLGYPDQSPQAPQRKPLNELFFYDKYGKGK